MNTEAHAEHGTNAENSPKKKSLIGKIFKWLVLVLLVMVIGMVAFVIVRFRHDAQIPYKTTTEGITIPTYERIELPFSQNYVKPKQIQATGGCVFRLDDDEVEELFLAGGQDQNDVIYRFEDGGFKDITDRDWLHPR